MIKMRGTPLRLDAGRLLAFLGAGEARMEGPPPGLVVLSVVARETGRWSACGGQLGGLLGGCWWFAGDVCGGQ